VPSAADQVSAAIVAAGGAIPFNQFMQLALYGDAGFYTTTGQAGRRAGDFITSPEVGPLFGTMIARSILAAKPQCMDALRNVAVEASAAQRASHPDNIESRETMPEGPITGVVLANELIENLPFRPFVFDDAWTEAFVAQSQDGAFIEMPHKPTLIPFHRHRNQIRNIHDLTGTFPGSSMHRCCSATFQRRLLCPSR
jgi:SAM-dependent MidA family methyltransferase